MPEFYTALPMLLMLGVIGAFAGVMAGLLGVGGHYSGAGILLRVFRSWL